MVSGKFEDFLKGIVNVADCGRVIIRREAGASADLYHFTDESGHEIATFFRAKGKPLTITEKRNEKTGGKPSYCMIPTKSVVPLIESDIPRAYIAYLYLLADCVEEGTGRLRAMKRGKPSLSVSDIAKKLKISMKTATRFVSVMREKEIFDKRDRAYWVNRAYLARGLKRGEVEKGQTDRTVTDSEGVKDS